MKITDCNKTVEAIGPGAQWPSDDLETVAACPVCRSERREVLCTPLTDTVFFCAPGDWTLYRCLTCRGGYLDPRPTPQTIALAYSNYFTHKPASPPFHGATTRFGQFKAAFRNDYLKSRYGTALGPRLPLGRLAIYLATHRKFSIDRFVRHLAPPVPGAKLLDVGCGNGDFLTTARALGWEARGIDPDAKAVVAARAAGLPVEHGGFPGVTMPDGYFDAVTINHVIEHLHDPLSALREVRRILKPGGTLWIATPNLDSIGSRYYGVNWRGLEPPRHLVLFTPASLTLACSLAGFPVPTFRRSQQAQWIFRESEQIANGVKRANGWAMMSPRRRWASRAADVASLFCVQLAEEIIAVARK